MTMMKAVTTTIAALSLNACVADQNSISADSARGKRLFDDQCAICHGANGEGAGPASLGLGAPPPSLQFLAASNDGVFPRNYVLSVIQGLDRHTDPTAAMPIFGDADMGQPITVNTDGATETLPSDMLALLTYLKTVQR